MSVRTFLKRRSKPRKHSRTPSTFRPGLEPLEMRLAPACTVGLGGGNLRVICDGAGDNIIVNTPTATTTRVIHNGFVDIGQNSQFNSLIIETGAGNDIVWIDEIAKTVSLDLGAGNDDLFIAERDRNLDRIRGGGVIAVGGGGGDRIILDDRNSGFSGTYTVASQFLTRNYQTVDRPGAFADVWFAGFAWGGRLNGSAGLTTFDVRAVVSQELLLDTGDGNNAVLVQDTTQPLYVLAGGGDDLVQISPTARNLNDIQGYVQVNGGAGQDGLTIDDSANAGVHTWTLAEDVGLSSVLRTGTARIDWNNGTGMESGVTISAGAGASTFNIADTRSLGFTTLNTGPGNDTVNVLRTTTGLNVTASGAAAADTVNIGNAGRVQNIQGAVSVSNQSGGRTAVNVNNQNDPVGRTVRLDTVVQGPEFIRLNVPGSALIYSVSAQTSSFAVNLGSSDDAILVERTAAGVTTTINGGDGNDDFALGDGVGLGGIAGSVRLNGQAGAGGGGFARVNDTIGTDARTYTWDGGTLRWGAVAVEAVNLGAFNLIGGQGDDVVAVLPGVGIPFSLFGGGGWNALDYSAWTADVYVNLQTGTATGVAGGLANISQVAGGAGNDILVGAGGNYLLGGAGHDLLIAGAFASWLDGGEGDDLLIGGVTSYDGDDASLAAIRDYWAGGDDYATRVANLTTGAGVPVLDASTVFSNGGGNGLLGGEGLDLFFGSPDFDFHDWDPAAETFVVV